MVWSSLQANSWNRALPFIHDLASERIWIHKWLISKSHRVFAVTLPDWKSSWLRKTLDCFQFYTSSLHSTFTGIWQTAHTFVFPLHSAWWSINTWLLNTNTFSPSSLDFDRLISQAHISKTLTVSPRVAKHSVLTLEGKLHQLLNTHKSQRGSTKPYCSS